MGFTSVPFGATDADRPSQPGVERHPAVHRGVQQDRTERHPDRAIDRAVERHVDRPVVDLRRRAGEVDRDVAAGNCHGNRDGQLAALRIVVVQEAIDRAPCGVAPVRERRDGAPHRALGIVHERVAGRLHGGEPVALDQAEKGLGTDSGRRDLRRHVAKHQVGCADIVGQHRPQRRVLDPLVVDLEALELNALGIGVDGVDDAGAARRVGADIDVMGGGRGEADERAFVEHRHAERDIGHVARAAIGVVVDVDVTGLDRLAAPLECRANAAHVARQRARLERRALRRLGDLVACRVHDGGAEILGLPDQARMRHAHELEAHLDGDRLQRAVDHVRGDRIDRSCGPIHPALLVGRTRPSPATRIIASERAGPNC